ncbi:MAG: nucleoside recognition domain-containing protein [Geminicoccaceae bacterium]|nr:nucleoside recognition domain-containing protein [Geminicoccaceae bacterium]MCB9943611.1 nucleoside recognition domain-containing protein [Geminicoccaceae bacterium]
MTRLNAYLQSLGRRSLSTFWEMARIMVPIMILIRIAEHYDVIARISPVFVPAMELVNLPGAAAIVVLTSILASPYGAIATLPLLLGLDITVAQLTAICAMMLFAHAIPVEQAIVARAGGSFWGTTAVRLLAAVIAAWLIDIVSRTTGYLAQPANLSHFAGLARPESTLGEWAWASISGMGLLAAILFALLLLFDIFDATGFTRILNGMLAPLMRLAGLDSSVTSITTAGALLGLAFGGGLIIARGRDPSISRRARTDALIWLSLCHGLIEDTAVMVAIGGDFWTLFAGRILLSLVIIRTWILFDRRGKGCETAAA